MAVIQGHGGGGIVEAVGPKRRKIVRLVAFHSTVGESWATACFHRSSPVLGSSLQFSFGFCSNSVFRANGMGLLFGDKISRTNS
jgi:hypothetical protein